MGCFEPQFLHRFIRRSYLTFTSLRGSRKIPEVILDLSLPSSSLQDIFTENFLNKTSRALLMLSGLSGSYTSCSSALTFGCMPFGE
ncbi:MAG: hypothetical protein ACTS73_09690 [Arsenophonus sp. NEOnobi-MAG3]